MKSLAEAIDAHNALDKVANRMSAEAFREHAVIRAQEEAFTEGVKDEIEEQIKAWAFNAGLSTREQFTEVMERGELGSEVLDYLTRIGAETPEAAVEALYTLAGHEAGKMLVDPYTRAFDRKTMRLGQEHPLFRFVKPDLPLKRKGKKPMSKAELGEIANFQRWLHGENE